MACIEHKALTMEGKIDIILDKLNKMDAIENHISMMKHDISGIKLDLKHLDTRMSDIENSVSYMETDFTDVSETVKKQKLRISKIEAQMRSLVKGQDKQPIADETLKQMEHMKAHNEQLSKQISDIDSYSRRSNLIFEGIAESRSEIPWKKVQNVLNNKLGIDCSHIKIERCHRLQGGRTTPKPIIVRFNWYADRQAVWENRRFLRGSQIFIREDFPPAVQRARISLNHTLSLAKTADKRASLKGDKLIFKGVAYDADKIPSEILMLGEAGPAAKVVNGYVCFSGRASPFSNFYKAPFTAEGKHFETNEHFYQYYKAKCAEDDSAAASILAESDPAKAKWIGNKVKVKAEWYGNTALNVMTSGIVQKFQQNETLKRLLTKCASLKFVECTQYDSFWGNGLKWTDAKVGDPSKWKGKNTLGACLQEASKHFKGLYSQAAKHPGK
jgi:ribA/ribD-fused uncharacterized protein